MRPPGLACIWLIAALWLAGAATAAGAAEAAVHITHVERSDPAPGDYAPPPSTIDARSLPLSWRPVSLPDVSEFDPRTSDPKATLSVWYRARVSVAPSDQALFLYMPRWQASGRIAIYADGRLIYAPRSGPVWNSFNLPVWVELAPPGAAPPREILIHLDRLAGPGASLSSLWVGDHSALAPRHALRQALQIDAPKLSVEIFLAVGLVALVVWLRRREEPAYLLVFAVAAMEFIHSLEYFVGVDPIPIADGWFQWIESNSETWFITFTFILATYYVEGDFKWYRRIIVGLSAAFSVATLLSATDVGFLKAIMPELWISLTTATAAIAVICWMRFFRRRTREGLVYCLFASVSAPAGVHDILMSRHVVGVEDIYWIPLEAIVQAALFLYIVSYSHARALDEAMQSRAHLAERLRSRETELEATYRLLRESEHQQLLTGERQRLMRDMHDGVGSALMRALTVAEGGGLDERDTAQLLRECIDDLKLTIDSLEPVDNDLLLMLATVRYRLEPRFEQAGVVLTWTVDELPLLPSLKPEHALHLLRMVQEIFTNILKHARASGVRVAVTAAERELVIAIEDDGVGFAPAAAEARSPAGVKKRGLANLEARAEAIGACIRWSSQPGSTLFELRLALPADETQAVPA